MYPKTLLSIILLLSQLTLFGNSLSDSNKNISVMASKPAGIKNFSCFQDQDDFYFVGEREREGAINFEVSVSVTQPDFTLKSPSSSPVSKSTNGGLITSYEVTKDVGGEMSASGDIYFVVVSAEIAETFEVNDDTLIGISQGTSENPQTKITVEAVGASDWSATMKVIPDDQSVEVLPPMDLSSSSNSTNLRITKGYSLQSKETKQLEITFDIKGNDTVVMKNLDLLPVEIKVNDTIKEEDDLVPVSKGTDEDLATDFSVKVSGMTGLTADLKVKGADGGIKFKDQTLTLTNGVEAKTKLWGTSPSSNKNKTIIEITLKKGSEELGKIEEEVTVFKGVKLEFKGRFIANVDSRKEGWRPFAVKGDSAALIAQDVSDYSSAIQFQPGDQGKPKRTWAANPEVTVSKVSSLDPVFELDKDPLKGSKIYANGGRFEHDTFPIERILDFDIVFKSGANELLRGTIANADATAHKLKKPNPPVFPVDQQTGLSPAAVAYIDKVADAPNTTLIKNYYKTRQGTVAGFTSFSSKWENDKLKLELKSQESMAVKGLIGAQEKSNPERSKIDLIFEKFNIWDLRGEINDGVIQNN